MHIVFEDLTSWQMPILKLLKYLKFKVFYLDIVADSDFKKNEIADRLKKKNILPLPLELEKKFSPKGPSTLCNRDPEEISYKRNMKLAPDEILKKYCNLFSIKDGKIKKLRLLLQDVIGAQVFTSGKLDIWSALYPSKRIIYISFKIMSFYMSNKSSNLTKIIIPLDIFNYFIKIIKKNFLLFTIFKNKKQKSQILNNQNSKELAEKKVAFIVHKGLTYGHPPLFYKSHYYSDDKNSSLNKYNILHLDYENYPSPEPNIYWICLKKVKVPATKIFFKTLLFSLKAFYLIRNWSTFLVWILCIRQYSFYAKYFEIIKKFKNLKIALIDYDCLCPKTLILACDNNNIKTVAIQERFMTTFYTSFSNVMLDTYYVASEHSAKVIKKSKYYDIKNIIPVGQYRSDYISFYKKQAAPKEISKAKSEGKKVLIIFGNHSPNNWFESYTHPLTNWSAQINFLENCIKLSQNLENTFIILRYKTLDWIKNDYFKEIFDKIYHCENIIVGNNYEELYYSYKLCAHADLIVAKATSIADECLSKKIPVLFHEYTHNLEKILLDIPNYIPSELICHNFEELLQKSKSLLFDDASKLQNVVTQLNEKIYYVNNNGNIKNKIIKKLENLIS